jgi:hypothetical protein
MDPHRPVIRSIKLTQTTRPILRPRTAVKPLVRFDVTAAAGIGAGLPAPSSVGLDFAPDPHVDYGRFLTPEGGVLFTYKDLDLRFRYTVWRIFAWTVSTASEGWFLFTHSPLQTDWINGVALLAVGLFNWIIVAKPMEVYRTVEVRPDCMIIEGTDVFWVRDMEGAWPYFKLDAELNQVCRGIYGTRFVEYFTVRRFDEFDRMPEVFTFHWQEVTQQLWETARTLGTVRRGAPFR